MESQPQNTEFRNNPENFHLCIIIVIYFLIYQPRVLVAMCCEGQTSIINYISYTVGM